MCPSEYRVVLTEWIEERSLSPHPVGSNTNYFVSNRFQILSCPEGQSSLEVRPQVRSRTQLSCYILCESDILWTLSGIGRSVGGGGWFETPTGWNTCLTFNTKQLWPHCIDTCRRLPVPPDRLLARVPEGEDVFPDTSSVGLKSLYWSGKERKTDTRYPIRLLWVVFLPSRCSQKNKIKIVSGGRTDQKGSGSESRVWDTTPSVRLDGMLVER